MSPKLHVRQIYIQSIDQSNTSLVNASKNNVVKAYLLQVYQNQILKQNISLQSDSGEIWSTIPNKR